METINEKPAHHHAADSDNATKPTANAEREGASETNRAGDEKSRHYMNRPGEDPQGPNYNEKSKNADGDTTLNAGVFK
jgi:hypothetical protein